MFDEIMEVFDRDGRRRNPNQPQKRGIRGFFSRMMGGDSRPEGHQDSDDDDGDALYERSRDRRRDRRDRRDDDGPDFGLD